MSSYELIDESEDVPSIKGTRVNVIDVISIINSPYQDEDEVFEYWDLSDEQVTAAIDYYKENTDKIEQLKDEIKET